MCCIEENCQISLKVAGLFSEIPVMMRRKSCKAWLVDMVIFLHKIKKLVNKTVSNSCPSIFISGTWFEG